MKNQVTRQHLCLKGMGYPMRLFQKEKAERERQRERMGGGRYEREREILSGRD